MSENDFGRNLQRVLSVLGLTQGELAIKTGVTSAAISQIINGHREPNLSTIIKILKVLPVKFEKLLERD